MKVTLIHPPVLLNRRSLGTMKPTLPIGLAYVAAAAREAGHDVRVVDAVAIAPHQTAARGPIIQVGAGVDDVVASIPSDTEVIAIGVTFSFLWPTVRPLVHALKRRFPDVPIVLGGEHVTALTDRSFREAPLDVAVLGEGEETFVELLDAYASGARQLEPLAGIAFRRGGTVHRTPRRERIREVDSIAPPAWDLFDVAVYHDKEFSLGMRLGRSMPLLATRGCPYACTFCTSPNMWTRRWVARAPAKVVDEMAAAHERFGATDFPFHDLTAVIRRDWVVAFCEELLRRGLRITWQLPAGTRCEAFDREVAELMVRSGCSYLAFAPESGSEGTRERILKKVRDDALFSAVDVAVAAGVHVTCYFIIGLPGDERDDLRATERLVRELARRGVEDISAHYFYPAPGTQLYRELDAAGRLDHSDEELMCALLNTDLVPHESRVYCAVPPAELAAWRYRVFLAFYGTRFASRPGRLVSLALNVLAGRETNKLEAVAREVRQRLRMRRAGARA